MNKSDDQLRKWRNPRIRVVNNFIKDIGDKSLVDITREDILAFRDSWVERIEKDGMDVRRFGDH